MLLITNAVTTKTVIIKNDNILTSRLNYLSCGYILEKDFF